MIIAHSFESITRSWTASLLHCKPSYAYTKNMFKPTSLSSYIVFPKLEKWLPRHKVIQNIDNLVAKFQGILEHKKENKGNDMLTYMLEEPGMTDEEYRDNM